MQNRPLCGYVWTRLSERWKDKTGLGVYADGMQELDWVVGELLAKVDELGIADNTVVVFTTSEAEWEFACRGELDGATYAWGEEFTPANQRMANTWQGQFPVHDTRADGHAGTAPVGSYPASGYGLYDMIGNMWEWTADWHHAHSALVHTCCTLTNPRGGDQQQSHDPQLPQVSIPRRVMKGGSHLCAPN